MELIRSGRVTVDDLITHRFSLNQIGEGFKIASEGKNSLKVIIEPQKK